ncbi:MAG TPA: glutaredoxin family protein [Marmoricola sp.]|nr:glutaredoxin family protein [Nocardioidaceae bacterium]HMU35875.1 glutaredoxin family protein [Marmoricola sp.]MCB8992302.1 glutaredoxin family protein [Nocardioidaceae bacterium]MCO5323938.1 glutaredoxin family protein [Nocardioidaceae bacterium]HMY09606.1 glutaredoxin family protein [Marmoricola sp.]
MANRVLLYGKPGCHLCDEALVIIKRVCDDLAVGFEEVDISQDANLMKQYGEQIPVTFVDGRQHDYWRVDEARLRKALG